MKQVGYFKLPKNGLAGIALALVMTIFNSSALAIDTSASIRGVVVDQSGNPVAGATVTAQSEGTSLTRSADANATGVFLIRNLPVGSTYTVTASEGGYSSDTFENIALVLGQTTALNFTLASAGVLEEMVVTGSRIKTQVAVGPSASFGLKELESAPNINRNITDILRIDPRVYVDESRGDINAIQCGGKNSRFNSWTVDGVRMNDLFGLNSNGYPTERMPIPYDAIQQVSVELSPFDAKYGGFTACNINSVTKSGSNEFYGGFFFDYSDDSMRGDTLEGDDIEYVDYDETRWGVNFGGPIIEDKLYFFAAYEKWDGANLFERGPIGSGAVNEVLVTQAELDEILDIARTVYQYDPGSIPSSVDNEDEKYMVKLDWYINDYHRLAFTYNYNDGFNVTQSDGDLNEFEFSNHLYERGAELDNYVATLYSDWSDNFSTEIRLGHLKLDNRQISVGGTDFGEIRVELADVDVYLGGDDSRQSNKLDYEVDTISFRGNYDWNGHELTFGFEREALDIFNLFIQHTETEIRFRGMDNFRNGFARAIYYNNAPSHNPNDAAADWGYEINTVYLQDKFDLTDTITIVAGLRYEWYTSDDEPVTNPDFVADYGFSNGQSFDGEGLIQPRFGITWDISEDLTLRGGVGRYSGGNPNVWLSNNFSNNNVLQFGQRGRSFGYTNGSRSLFDADVIYKGLEPGVPNGPGWGVPAEIYDAVSGGTGDNFEINYLDPSFDLPSEWKMALGFTYYTENMMQIQGDVIWTRGEDTAMVRHGDLERIGQTADGYPIYDSVREASFVLTNSDEGNRSLTASIFLSKAYDNGFDWTFGYTYNDAEDVQPMTSSVAFSNYQNRAFFDPEEDVLSTSNYNIAHRLTATFNWEKQWFGDNITRISLYASANEGPPYSYAYNGTIVPYGFTPYLDFNNNVLAPGDRRNDQEGSWWAKVDFKIEQEFNIGPGQASAFLVIDNLTNMINDDWGVLEKVNFPNNVVRGAQEEARIGDASIYEIRIGVEYNF
jgi:outer membrane receptor for ferrienterochelin and colicin